MLTSLTKGRGGVSQLLTFADIICEQSLMGNCLVCQDYVHVLPGHSVLHGHSESMVVPALVIAVTRCPTTLSPNIWELACCTHLAWPASFEETGFDLKAAPPALHCPRIHCTVHCQQTAL